MSNTIKKGLIDLCQSITEEKITRLKHDLSEILESKKKETKSSVGDKYETGRAMLHLEENKLNSQLAICLKEIENISKVDLNKLYSKVEFGSLIYTNKNNYFILFGIGKVFFESEDYYVISMNSPLAQSMKDKTSSEQLVFQDKSETIKSIH